MDCWVSGQLCPRLILTPISRLQKQNCIVIHNSIQDVFVLLTKCLLFSTVDFGDLIKSNRMMENFGVTINHPGQK